MMNANLQAQIYKNFEAKHSEELKQIYQEHNDEEWSEDAFRAIHQILVSRGEIIPHITIRNTMEKDKAVSEKNAKLKEASWAWKIPLYAYLGSLIIKSAISWMGGIPFGGYIVLITNLSLIILHIVAIVYIVRAWTYNIWYGQEFLKHALFGTIIVGFFLFLIASQV